MKAIFFLAIISLIIFSCSSTGDKTAATDTTIVGDTLAKAKDTPPAAASGKPISFLHTSGKDSTYVELTVTGDKVSGKMNWIPYQKDSRKGTLEGAFKKDTIHGKWRFMQEGMNDTLAVDLILKDNHLLQKPLKLNTKTGRDQTDSKAGYTITYGSVEKK